MMTPSIVEWLIFPFMFLLTSVSSVSLFDGKTVFKLSPCSIISSRVRVRIYQARRWLFISACLLFDDGHDYFLLRTGS